MKFFIIVFFIFLVSTCAYDINNTEVIYRYGKIIDYPTCSSYSSNECRIKVQFLNTIEHKSIHGKQNPLIDDTVTELCYKKPIFSDYCTLKIGYYK